MLLLLNQFLADIQVFIMAQQITNCVSMHTTTNLHFIVQYPSLVGQVGYD